MSDSTITVEVSPRDQRFYQGVSVANKVLDAHKDIDFPDEGTRTAMFFFYAGALAGAEHGCTTSEDFEPFLLGLATRAPQPRVTTTTLPTDEHTCNDDTPTTVAECPACALEYALTEGWVTGDECAQDPTDETRCIVHGFHGFGPDSSTTDAQKGATT